jgi:sterol desaturase/sphingolipid hydroxylase (fatty acid hydroxylase superfamily)
MEDKMNFIEPIFERVGEYGKTSFELFKLKTIDKTAGVASTFISRATAILMLFMFILILTIGVALWLGDLLGKSYYGFFCVAGFYALIGGVLYFFMHDFIKKIISNSIISHLLN